MPSVRPVAAFVLGALLTVSAACTAQMSAPARASQGGDLPLKLAPRPTTAPITSADLMTRLYIFADDSMMGRQVGTEYNLKGTAYIGRAAGVLVASLDRIPANMVPAVARPPSLIPDVAPPAGPLSAFIAPRVADLVFGSLDSARIGAVGRPLTGTLVVHDLQAPGRNVVAILPGSDPVLKNEYVAIGAHNDQIGFNNRPVDHDSIRAFNMVARVQGADSPRPTSLTAEQERRIRAITDSLHARHGARRDSINNGADDDGSGSMSVLEIAEALATARTKPKRSILFVWHTGEEAGLWGSEHFTDHPTVPRESIVAQLNMDMVGRGAASDVTGELKEGGLA